VHRAVDEHGGRFHRMAPGEDGAGRVDHHDVVGLHFAPVQAARVDEELVITARQCHAEMVADALAQAVVGGSAQGQRQIGPQLRHSRRGERVDRRNVRCTHVASSCCRLDRYPITAFTSA
jgi:hypothetical protein